MSDPAPVADGSLVVQTGTYSSWNKGDAAMQLAAREGLTAKGCRVIISTPFPEHDRSLYGAEICRSPRRSRVLVPFILLSGLVSRLVRGPMRSGPRVLASDPEGRAMARADLVLDLSGDMLTESSGVLVGISHLVPLFRAWAMGRPFVIGPQSIGPFRRTRLPARFLLSRARIVMARESVTEDYLLETLGIPRERVIRAPDLAFLLEPNPDAGQLIAGVPRPRIGVTVSRLVAKRHRSRGPSSFVGIVARALDRIHDDLGVHPVLFAHVTGPTPDKDDRVMIRRISRTMNAPSHVVDHDLHPADIKGAIGACDFFLGSRMHSNIAALSQGVPTTAISYSHKAEGIMDSLGQGDLVLDSRSLTEDDIVKAVEAMTASRDARRTELRRLADVQRAEAREAVERVARMAMGGH